MKYKTFRSVLCLLLAVVMTGSLFNYALPVEAEAANKILPPAYEFGIDEGWYIPTEFFGLECNKHNHTDYTEGLGYTILTSHYGYRGDIGIDDATEYHWALDIGDPYGVDYHGHINGKPVWATRSGKIVVSTNSYGKVEIQHKVGNTIYYSGYLHMKDRNTDRLCTKCRICYPESFTTCTCGAALSEGTLKKGDYVYQGAVIGHVGGIGKSGTKAYKDHLHFYVHDSDKKPIVCLPKGMTCKCGSKAKQDLTKKYSPDGLTYTKEIFQFMPNVILYNPNGENVIGQMPSLNMASETSNSGYQLPENQFFNPGYTFSGWKVQRSTDKAWLLTDGKWGDTGDSAPEKAELLADKSSINYKSWAADGENASFTLYAQWKPLKHTVIVDREVIDKSEESITLSDVETGTSMAIPATFSQGCLGYRLQRQDGKTYVAGVGWVSDTEVNPLGSEMPKVYEFGNSYGIDHSWLLEGRWSEKNEKGENIYKEEGMTFTFVPLPKKVKITLRFDAKGGSGAPKDQTATQGSLKLSSQIPVRSGQKFCGWLDSTTNKIYQPGEAYVSFFEKDTAITLEALWEKDGNYFTIKYDYNDGSGKTESLSYRKNSDPAIRSAPTRSGYTFDHWCTDPDSFWHLFAKEYQPGDQYTADKDITLYAHWEKSSVKSYTVTFDANGGSGTQKKTFNEGVSLGELPVPTRSGYSFQGWYTAASGGSQISSSTKVTKNVTYYAHWTKTAVKSYTVNFEYNAGNDTGECRQYKEGESLGELPKPTRSGYSLEGWYTAASGGSRISSSMKVTENVTYYAHWKQQSDYMASCTRYPSYGSVRVKVTDNIYSLPCDSGTDSHSVKGSAQSAGTWLSVDGLYKNSKGQYWYSVEMSSGTGYFNAANTASFQCAPLLKDVTIDNPSLPKDLVQDKSYSIGGTIRSDRLYLNEVTGSIQDSYGNGSSKTLRYSNDQRCTSLNLKSSAINTALKFGSLKAGDCQYVITVSADYYYSTDGKSLNSWRQTEDLIWHEFKVKAQGKDVRFLSEGKEIYSTTVTEKDNYLTMQSKPYSKPGHTFKGWNAYRDSDSTWYTDKGWQTQSSIDKNKYTKKVYPAGNSYNLYHSSWGDSDFTFHAVWEYTGSGKDARFVSDEKVISSFHATPGNNMLTIVSAPAGKPGYTFRGWNVQRDNDSTWYVAGHGWNSEGSIATNNYTKKLYAPGTKIDLYDFTWVDEASVTFYALWEYTGSGKDVRFVSDGTVISSFHATPGNNVLTVAAAPDGRPGYTFQGWNVQRDADGTWYVAGHGWNSERSIAANKYTKKLYSSGAKIDLYDFTWVDEASVSFYALWEAPTFYAVTYDANGGTDAPAEQQKIAGTDLTLSDSEPSRPGYRFLGWAADSAATAPEYQPGDTYSADAVLTLYAVWEYLGSLEIPDVTGMYFGEAMQLLSLSGFRPQTSGTIYYSKYVATQSPAAGEYGEPGDAVTLTVTDTAPASVPRLVGKYPINDDAVRSWEEQGSATFVYGFNHQSICRCDTSTGAWEDLPYVTDKLCQVVLSFGPNSWARSFKMVIECEDTNCRARLYFGEDYYGSYNAILLHLNKGNYTVKAYDSSGALFDSAPLKVTGSGSYEVIFDAFTDEKNLAPNLVGMRFDEALALLEARGNGVERAEDFNDDDIVVKQWPFAGNFVYPNITFELTCSTTSAYKHVVIDPATGEGYAWSGNGDPISVQKDSLTQPLSSVTLRLIGSDYEDHPMWIVVGSSTKTAKLPISPDENGTVALYAAPGSQYTLGVGTSDGSYGFGFHVDGDGEIDLDLTHTVTIYYFHYVNSVLYKTDRIATSSFCPSITLCTYDVTKEGYTFAGWSTDGSNPVLPGSSITIDVHWINLYPVWTENVPDGKKAVPDVTGMRFDEACALLKEQGFVVNETAYNADDIVIGQGPKAGILVEPGSAVELSCSVTSAYQYVVIDSVTGEGRAWSGAGNTIPDVVQKDSLTQTLNDVKLRITGSGYQGYPMVISKRGQSSPTFGLVVTPDENGELSILAAPNQYDLWIEATEGKALHFPFTVNGDGTIDIDLTRKINVSYYNEDGSLYKTDEVDTSSVFTTITLGAYDQVKDGYTFAGWSANGGTPNLPGSFVFTAFDISFTAVWTENTPDEEPGEENDAPKTYEALKPTTEPEPTSDPEPTADPEPTPDPVPTADPIPIPDPEPTPANEPEPAPEASE